jgi:hypothetical protein
MARFQRFFATAVALTLAGSTGYAQDKKTDLEKLVDRITELENKVGVNKTNVQNEQINLMTDLSALKIEVQKLQNAVNALSKTPNTDGAANKEKETTAKRMDLTREEQDKKIEKLEKEIAKLKMDGVRETRRMDMMTKYGYVRVSNDTAFDKTLILEGRSYNLAPRSQLELSVPVGQFSYQVPEIEFTTRTRTLVEKQVFLVEIK